MDKCKSCDADIFWARASKSKKWMPLDAIRIGHGVRFVMDDDALAYTTTVGQGHPSHYATCPSAQRHRKDDRQGELNV
jgi:hypothetical protein